MKYDFLIVGGGIAGSVLAYKMQSKGYRIKLYDYHNPASSSRVAAGLLNPVTGRRFSLTWKAGKVFSELHRTYSEMERLCGETLVNKLKIVRLCNSIAEYNDWSAKASDDRYQSFIDNEPIELHEELLEHKAGALTLTGGGYLNTNKTLSFVHHYLGNSFQQVATPIKPDDIFLGDGSVKIGDDEGKNIVLAEGYLAFQSPFFGYLPFTPMKGEILELVIPNFYEDRVFIRGGFLVPFGNSTYRAGATYDSVNLNQESTDEGQKNILDRLEKYLKADYSVKNRFAGVRPAVKDRRPLVGVHPKHSNMFLFNGFGSKGSSLAPYMSDLFIDMIENDTPLPAECDILRYESLFLNSKI